MLGLSFVLGCLLQFPALMISPYTSSVSLDWEIHVEFSIYNIPTILTWVGDQKPQIWRTPPRGWKMSSLIKNLQKILLNIKSFCIQINRLYCSLLYNTLVSLCALNPGVRSSFLIIFYPSIIHPDDHYSPWLSSSEYQEIFQMFPSQLMSFLHGATQTLVIVNQVAGGTSCDRFLSPGRRRAGELFIPAPLLCPSDVKVSYERLEQSFCDELENSRDWKK